MSEVKDNRRRLGRFGVSEELLFDPEQSLLGAFKFLALQPINFRECSETPGAYEVVVWSPAFQVLAEGATIPQFRLFATSTRSGTCFHMEWL